MLRNGYPHEFKALYGVGSSFDVILYFQGTIIIKTGEELMNFSKGEENQVEEVSIV